MRNVIKGSRIETHGLSEGDWVKQAESLSVNKSNRLVDIEASCSLLERVTL